MATPKVSIIIPVYNTEKYLEHCIGTLTSQTLEDIEIIMVDDGSADECARLCDKLAEGDSRVKVIHKANAGQGLARNTGLQYATGEYIGFVDSDDYVSTDMYEALYNSAIATDADIVMSGVTFVGGNTFSKSEEYTEEKHYFDKETTFENDGIKELLLGIVGALPHEPDDSKYGVSVWKNIFKRSVIKDNNIEFVSERKIISEDTMFLVDFMKYSKKAVGIHGAFYRYRRNDESFSKAYKPDRCEKILIFLTELENHIKATLTREEYKLYLDRLVQGYGRILCSQEIVHARCEKIKYTQLRKRLQYICTRDRIKNVLKTYPWYKLPPKQAVFAFAMKYRLYLLQTLLVILRDR